jgi:hypothetical protein
VRASTAHLRLRPSPATSSRGTEGGREPALGSPCPPGPVGELHRLSLASWEVAPTTYPVVVEARRAVDVNELARRINENGRPATSDDQSKTWDGRVLNSKAAVLAFLEEVDVARREGRTLEP